MKIPAFLTLGGAALPLALAAIIAPQHAPASAADWDAGADVFETYCSDCHSVSPNGTNRKGPSLFHVMGRRAGTVAGFDYSPQMRGSGIVWNPASLNAYLANPDGAVPGGKMKKGLPKPADRANVIEFLSRPE
jgi:cytochrome c